MALDYSKWDKMVAEMSDEEEEEPRRPNVTYLGKPTSVTIGGGEQRTPGESTVARIGTLSKQEKDKQGDIKSRSISLSRNGNSFEKYCWSQDKEEVQLSVWIESGIGSKRVKVVVSKDKKRLDIKLDKNIYLSGELAYDVEVDEDYDGGVEWQLDSVESRRRIAITLKKKCPIQGATLWWSRFFKREEKVDTAKIKDRRKGSKGMKEAWEEAHKLFRAKVAKQRPTYIDDDGNVVDVDEKS
eukprot:jgi/Bigna1/85272/estExt_fgenesh1_pg.C_30119